MKAYPEYITTLEGDIAERDRLIDAIRTELGSSQSENAALRQEIGALKKALLASAGRAESPALPPPGPIPVPTRATASSSLVTPNTQKDLPSSPRLAASVAKAFWGGSTSFGGITPVHTTLIPENFTQPLANVKPLAGARAYSSVLQENINPLLNISNHSNTFGGLGKPASFDSYAESNRFTMKMLDAYRMQLRSRTSQHQSTQSHQQPPPITGLAAGLRPHCFTSPRASSSSISSLLSGKHASTHPSPPSSPKLGPMTPTFTSSKDSPTAQEAMLAAMASQMLLQQLGTVFWQAFATPSSSSEANPNASALTWDADKIQRVLEGKAVLSIVDLEPEAKVSTAAGQTLPNNANTPECSKGCGLTATLEEGMRALSLSKE